MNLIRKITECDLEYTKCFCEMDKQSNFIRFKDDLIPDMWYHNYTWITNSTDDDSLLQFIESEVDRRKREGKNFCLVRCHVSVSDSVVAQLSVKPDVSIAGWYVMDDLSNLSGLKTTEGAEVVRVNTAEMLEDYLKLDLEHDGESQGEDFCTRRVYRRKEIYLSDDGVDCYICYLCGEAVGSCNLFVHNGFAKIEDFSVSPRHQRKGLGTTILKSLIEIALVKNVTTVYLETDEEDTAKEMYMKCGFKKVNEFKDLSFEI